MRILEEIWLTLFRVGMIIAAIGSLMGLISNANSLWLIGMVTTWTLHFSTPNVTIEMPVNLSLYLGTSVLLNIVALALAVNVYSRWSTIKSEKEAGKTCRALIVLAVLNTITSNTASLVGTIIAIFGLLSKYPNLQIKSSPEPKPSEQLKPKEITADEAYQRLLKYYREVYSTSLAEKKLEKEIQKLVEKEGLTREKAIIALYNKVFH